MLKVKTAPKGRPNNNVKHSPSIWIFLKFLSCQIKSDDIPPQVKSDDVNYTEIGKANKSVELWKQILFKLSGSMFY